jgi:type II secretory pathway pseudopilin PulG
MNASPKNKVHGAGRREKQIPFSDERGYTAIELVLAMAILGTVIFSTVQIFKLVQRSYFQVDEKSQVEQLTTFTMEQLVEEMRQASSIATLGTPSGNVLRNQTVHLDAGGNTVCSISIPNMTNGVSQVYNATLTYFLRTMPDGTVKLFQRMQYYNGSYTEAFPAMAHTDEYRLGKPAATPAVEPGIGTPTPTPSAANTPTPVYNTKLGRMPGLYNSPNFNFDDVSFYYDDTDKIVGIGLVVSIKSKSLSWYVTPVSRRRLTLTASITLRNLAAQ